MIDESKNIDEATFYLKWEQTKIDKVFVKGNYVNSIFRKLSKSKKGGILYSKSQIIELIKNELNINDYLMIKASNATGFNKIVKDLKGFI